MYLNVNILISCMKRKVSYPSREGGISNPLTPTDLKDLKNPIVFGEMSPLTANNPRVDPFPTNPVQDSKDKEPAKKITPTIHF
jgi:hypothetical protein